MNTLQPTTKSPHFIAWWAKCQKLCHVTKKLILSFKIHNTTKHPATSFTYMYRIWNVNMGMKLEGPPAEGGHMCHFSIHTKGKWDVIRHVQFEEVIVWTFHKEHETSVGLHTVGVQNIWHTWIRCQLRNIDITIYSVQIPNTLNFDEQK